VDDLVIAFCKQHCIPLELHLDLTNACTERCVHCYVPKGQKDFLSVELVEKALVEFRAMNGLTVHLTGGEAMMHPDFERICRRCVELNLNFIIFSNMTLCDDKRIAFLKEVAPQFINVSLYSIKPEEHDAITQLAGSWQRTMDAILKCCDAGVACRIATPLLKENQDALPALRKFADEHRMYFVPATDITAQSDHGCGNLAHACSVEELRRVMTRDHGLFHKIYEGKMPSCDAKVCDIGEARLYLNAKGNYYPCDTMHEYVLGNVRENTVEEIWKGEKLNYLRGLKNRDFGACASCEKRPWCKVCPAANFNATGDLFKHHPNACELAGVIREVYGKAATRDA
jgi:radical SAM protein with 4Fe4S-binding SPASM domain